MSDRRKKHYFKQLKEQTIKIEKKEEKKQQNPKLRGLEWKHDKQWKKNKDIKQLFYFFKRSFKTLERKRPQCLQLYFNGLLFLVKEEKMNGWWFRGRGDNKPARLHVPSFQVCCTPGLRWPTPGCYGSEVQPRTASHQMMWCCHPPWQTVKFT